MQTCACGCGQPVTKKWKHGHNPKRLGAKASEETKAKMSRAITGMFAGEKHPNWGKHLSQETRTRISQARQGITLSEESIRKMSATKEARYPRSTKTSAIHIWMNRKHPRRGICERCGKEGRTEYASINGHRYTRDRADYEEMCHSCHLRFDYANGRTSMLGLKHKKNRAA